MVRAFLLSCALALAVIGPLTPATAQATQQAEYRTVTLSVPGMYCAMCPITVRKALEKVPGVIKAEADYETKTATVTFDPAKTGVDALTEATFEAGYESTPKQP